MKKATLTAIFLVSFMALMFVPEKLNGWFFLDEAIKIALWVWSARELDKLQAKAK